MPSMSIAESETLAGRDTYRFGNGRKPVLQAGTIGWRAGDLDDPETRFLWDSGRFEIVEGVLTLMPPAYFRGGNVVDNLKFILKSHFQARQIRASFSGEVDIIVDESRVARADGVAVVGKDLPRFEALQFDPPKTSWKDHSLTLPPTIIIESISEGHEAHDRVTKSKWYADFKVPNYWIVDGFARTLECLRLKGTRYIVEAKGKHNQIVKPPSFPGLSIPLRQVWED